ncbi:MAG: AAA family ATPase [Chitinophagaceae bacterium]
MIKTVKISNFKSVPELELELGRLNVFIGENGCGKTNILEGIAMGSAAAEDKLDEEFLTTRGVRVVKPSLMISAFSKSNDQNVLIGFSTDKYSDINFSIHSENGTTFKVVDNTTGVKAKKLVYVNHDSTETLALVDNLLLEIEKSYIKGKQSEVPDDIRNKIAEIKANALSLIENTGFLVQAVQSLYPFVLYAPENFFLRNFENEGQIRPLGIRGEGLFRHLVELSKEDPETFKAIAEDLSFIDWFGGMSIPDNLQFTERRISITDRFISDTIKDFDQRSANEGFLYLLFYFTLFLSKYTPKFFAIDNIDNALNPRLCTKLVEVLARLAKTQDKQAILTTHNPAILDGLDLNDDEQRLFVIYRDADGATTARRVMPPKEIEGVEPVRLSEAFVRGYLGGLPNNF